MATVGFLGRLPQLQKCLPFELVNQLTLAELLREVVQTMVASKQREYPWLVQEPDGSLQLIVEDNGIGLNAEQLQSATNPFKSFTGKLGMGLFEVEKIVENYQGHLQLDSRGGQGAKVTVTLPAAVR